MTSLILRTATRHMFPLLLLFSVFLLLRGHNQPGGGFAGGLVGASAFCLYALSFGVEPTRQILSVDTRMLIGAGLLIAAGSAWLALLEGQPILAHQGYWWEEDIPGLGKLHIGTPLIFDLGVYLVVLGVTLSIILPLAEE